MRVQSGRPVAVRTNGRVRPIDQIREVWRIDDEWWRAPISRLYVDVVLSDGGTLTLFRDLMTGHWYAQ